MVNTPTGSSDSVPNNPDISPDGVFNTSIDELTDRGCKVTLLNPHYSRSDGVYPLSEPRCIPNNVFLRDGDKLSLGVLTSAEGGLILFGELRRSGDSVTLTMRSLVPDHPGEFVYQHNLHDRETFEIGGTFFTQLGAREEDLIEPPYSLMGRRQIFVGWEDTGGVGGRMRVSNCGQRMAVAVKFPNDLATTQDMPVPTRPEDADSTSRVDPELDQAVDATRRRMAD